MMRLVEVMNLRLQLLDAPAETPPDLRDKAMFELAYSSGLRLAELAVPLRQAGLERVNVSVDTLDADRFHRVTRWGHLDKVLEGVYAAEAAGLTPIKINAVLLRGENEHEAVGRDLEPRVGELGIPLGAGPPDLRAVAHDGGGHPRQPRRREVREGDARRLCPHQAG